MSSSGAANPSQTKNMYRLGDHIYVEKTPNAPYGIRRIDELIKNGTSVEIKVACFYRRRDLEKCLLQVADSAERKFEEYFTREEKEEDETNGHTTAKVKKEEQPAKEEPTNGPEEKEATAPPEAKEEEQEEEDDLVREWGNAGLPLGVEELDKADRHLFRHKELFFTRHHEIIECNQVRGRCAVTLLNEVEDLHCYEGEDHFFYSLVYDAANLTLVADKGAIRVGQKYQAQLDDIPVPDSKAREEQAAIVDDDDNKENGLQIDEGDEEHEEPLPTQSDEQATPMTERERIIYHPHHGLSDQEIDQFLIVARAVGTFSRALDTNSSARFPTLHMVAAAASRDVTLFHALSLLHQADYDLGKAVRFLCPPANKETYPFDAEKATGLNTSSLGGPILCRDQLEEWSTAESNLFEEALEKYGKDFHDMRSDYLPWKSVRDLVEYYYMWKTTNRYQDTKKAKNSESELKLKQVYIPTYNKVCENLVSSSADKEPIRGKQPCESCKTETSISWYRWGPAIAQLYICERCQNKWKKFAAIDKPHVHDMFDLKEAETELAAREAITGADKVTGHTPKIHPMKSLGGHVVAKVPTTHPAYLAARQVLA
ncbi:unnamed protein product, partial [Mesorhabditis spiculigera]